MRIAAVVLLALVMTPVAGAAPSFDCQKAQTAAEGRICNDSGLQWSDRQLARLYALALKEAPQSGRAALIESQRRFLVERDACGTVPLGCVESLYHQRLQELATRVNVHDAYAMFARGSTGSLRIARFGFTGAIELFASRENGNLCQFEEDNLTQTGKGNLRSQSKFADEECRIDIVPNGEDVIVMVEGCRSSCGHGTYMDGTYARIP